MTINSTLTGVVLTYRRNIKYIIYNIPQEIDKMGLFEAVADCCPPFLRLYFSFAVLPLVFLPGLYSAACRTAFLA